MNPKRPDEAETLGELRRALARPDPTNQDEVEAEVARLRPLVVPSEYRSAGLPGVLDPLPAPEFALAWVLLEPTTMIYLTPARAGRYEAEGVNWRGRAFTNLVRDPAGLATHEKRAEDGRLVWMALMQPDALGSSRVLLSPAWNHVFPNGYWVALPDRSCGLVVSKEVTSDELVEVRGMVAGMFERATTPMSGVLYDPEALAVPAAWFPPGS